MHEVFQDAINDLFSVQDWVRFAASRFSEAQLYFGHGTDNAWDEAVQLTLWALHTPFDRLGQVAHARITLRERAHLAHLIQRRIQERIPLAYLTGEAHFIGLTFSVTPDVLIPRSPIGELIENAFEPWLSQPPERILDLCTGSGCIGIACALAFEDAEIVLSDICPKALNLAAANITRHKVEAQVSTCESDLFSGLQGQVFDLIVSNPPYVDAADMASLPAEYHAEPTLALASGTDGLDFTRRLLREARQHLTDQGVLIVEVGNSWLALEEAFPQVEFTWLELSRGGNGVFLLTADQLDTYQPLFNTP